MADSRSFVDVKQSYQSTDFGPACDENHVDKSISNGLTAKAGATVVDSTVYPDKAPLLQANLFRSLSGFSGAFTFGILHLGEGGFVIGQAGILLTFVQLLLAYSIIFCTVLSLCAISTNGAIEGGGVYYMISRALGPEFGGSIGVLFFIANIFSCSLYTAGFTEALVSNFGPGGYTVDDGMPSGRWYDFAYAFCVTLVILVISLVGAEMFARTSLLVLVVVAVSYLSFILSLMVKDYKVPIPLPENNPFGKETKDENGTIIFSNATTYANYTGVRSATFAQNLYAHWGVDYTTGLSINFAVVFAVVFSGITGLMAGANMSGELKNPNLSIPRGTLQAVFTTLLIYMLTTFLVGASCTHDLLVNNYIVMQNINIWPPFILIGIFAATLAAAMSNLIGASRVLSRLADDRLFGEQSYCTSEIQDVPVLRQKPFFVEMPR
ncbi:unnamed protein product [Soboliphyme baturini]|uniref:Solute carrier family 12 member 9 n=1 Tax=Soboliphyme baturini TaxID=241478 RepID=A0A183IBU7_9BILA|nr:unnamed protein product [Soboliphyme baturini]